MTTSKKKILNKYALTHKPTDTMVYVLVDNNYKMSNSQSFWSFTIEDELNSRDNNSLEDFKNHIRNDYGFFLLDEYKIDKSKECISGGLLGFIS
jgi:hypothetical protein